ncbi:hypothetical protein G7Y89_g6570 [Cudoniella acicularis]|uniref:B30.2/SPRY domain-containing protein n=1 Tax=Cudoniella acicularis TaxID=354080 RepID=A0A8H4W2B1_9HELO|nr:hypothetical protein G7Y89_g6570 [Cudoniella acicularis]
MRRRSTRVKENLLKKALENSQQSKSEEHISTAMSTGVPSPQREATPTFGAPISSIPQKRVLEDDHQPTISSPLNPDFKPAKSAEDAPLARERASRAKKESLKKRESKGGSLATDSSARATPDPKASSSQKSKAKDNAPAPIRYKLPPPKISDFEAPRGPIFVPAHTKTAPDGTVIQFNETTDHVYNKKNFHYTHCIADPAFPSSLYYRQSETEPFGPRLNFEDTSTHMFLDEAGLHVTTDKGFRMAKANVAIRQGRYYWECKIISGIPKRKRSEGNVTQQSANGHVRMGWARREATLDAPVGFDAYSYGIRDAQGQKVFMSRPKDFFPPGQDIQEGDVIGLEINLPSETLHRKVVEGQYNPAVDLADDEPPGIETTDKIRDRVPIRFKMHLYFEQIEYHSVKELEELMNPSPVISTGGINGSTQEPGPTHPIPALRTLPHSNIKIYKNGELMGTPFKDLLAFLPPASSPIIQVGARAGLDDGMLGYYPAVSVFRGGAAEVNFGPDFWYPPPGYGDDETDMIGSDQPKLNKLRPAGERYDEQIVEDIVYDIVDEVDFWMQDGGVSGKGATNGVLRASGGVSVQDGMLGGGVLGSEIKDSGKIQEFKRGRNVSRKSSRQTRDCFLRMFIVAYPTHPIIVTIIVTPIRRRTDPSNVLDLAQSSGIAAAIQGWDQIDSHPPWSPNLFPLLHYKTLLSNQSSSPTETIPNCISDEIERVTSIMTTYTFEAALCLQCSGMVIAMDDLGYEELCKLSKNTKIPSTVAIWAVFCRRHSPPNTDKESYDYTKIFIEEDEILKSHSLDKVKRIMSPSILNPTHGGKMTVMASSVYPLGLTNKMIRFFMDMTSETIIIQGVPSSFM